MGILNKNSNIDYYVRYHLCKNEYSYSRHSTDHTINDTITIKICLTSDGEYFMIGPCFPNGFPSFPIKSHNSTKTRILSSFFPTIIEIYITNEFGDVISIGTYIELFHVRILEYFMIDQYIILQFYKTQDK